MRHHPTGGAPGRPGFGLVYVYRCRGLSSGRILSLSSPSSCSSCSPPKVWCAAASVALGRRSAAWALPPRPSASARYGLNCSRAFEIDRSFQNINAKGGIQRGGADDLKIAPFTLHISADDELGADRRWAMGDCLSAKAVRRAHRAGRGDATILRRVFAVDPLQIQRRGDCRYNL